MAHEFRTACNLVLLAALFAMALMPAGAAAQTLTISPLAWNVVGLDSNVPAAGPKNFPVGARVCSSVATTNVSVGLAWDSANAFIDFRSGSLPTVVIPSIGAGGCADAYFEVEVVQNAAAAGVPIPTLGEWALLLLGALLGLVGVVFIKPTT